MDAEEAAALIQHGHQIGMSGFTGSGYPKAVPMALARRIADANLRGQKFQVSIFTGASTGPELDGALAKAGGIHLRLPYQSDPETRKRINAGEMEYMDIHLSHVAQFVEYGFLGKLDLALIEVTAVLEDGRLVPELVAGQQQDLDRAGRARDHRGELVAAGRARRHARHLLRLAAAAESRADSANPYRAADRQSLSGSATGEDCGRGAHRLARSQQPVQSAGRELAPHRRTHSGIPGVGGAEGTHSCERCCRCNRAWATSPTLCCSGWKKGPFEGLSSYTEVIQDGMIRLLKSGKLVSGLGHRVLAEPGDADRS
jgi:succinyl-CoA:acetate CoA-transferase